MEMHIIVVCTYIALISSCLNSFLNYVLLQHLDIHFSKLALFDPTQYGTAMCRQSQIIRRKTSDYKF